MQLWFAVNPFTDPILSTPESALDKLWEVNVRSSILLLHDLSPHFEKGSSVIFITSIAAFQPQVPTAMYGVTKTALLGLIKALAAETGPDTRVNAVPPGVVPTHFASFITRKLLDRIQKYETIVDLEEQVSLL
ncbi:hypothetical protein Bca101_061619 [Brassica carinata]